MKCPIDDTLLQISDRQGIEIDYCPQCRGVWLDRGELDKIIERAGPEFGGSVASGARPPSRGYGDDDRWRASVATTTTTITDAPAATTTTTTATATARSASAAASWATCSTSTERGAGRRGRAGRRVGPGRAQWCSARQSLLGRRSPASQRSSAWWASVRRSSLISSTSGASTVNSTVSPSGSAT